MKQLSKLSEASERRISGALLKVAGLVEDGLHPTAAITKIATAEKLPAGLVRLAVRAYNTGASLSHIRDNNTLEDKAASFELADATEVLERMWPSKIKTASQLHHDTAISDDYSKSPDVWLTVRKQSAPMVKAAAASTPSPYPVYPHRESKRITTELETLRRASADADMRATKAAYAVVSTIDKVAAYFRDPYSVPFTVVQHNASIALGPRVKKLMQKVATDKTVLNRFRNEIRENNAKLLLHPVDWKSEPYTLIKDALNAVDEFAASQTNLTAVKTATEKGRGNLLRPFVVERKSDTILGSAWRDTEKQAALMDVNVHNGGGESNAPGAWAGLGFGAGNKLTQLAADTVKHFAPKSKNQLLDESLEDLSEPKHEDKLRAIRAQGMAHELMAGDPIIRGYPYRDTIAAYNHLAEIAPRAMQTRVMAQAMLRRYLEQSGSIDPFDAGALTDFNSKLTANDMPEALAKGGYRIGAMRSLGNPEPQRSMAVKEPEKKPGGFLGVGEAQLQRAVTAAPPKKPANGKKKDTNV